LFTWKYISQSQITQSTSTSSASDDDDDDDDNCQKKGFSNIGVDLGLGLGLVIGPVPFPGFLYFFYSLGTGLEKIWYRKKSWNRSRKNLVPKKVPEPVSKKFGTEKSLGTGLVQILGLVTH